MALEDILPRKTQKKFWLALKDKLSIRNMIRRRGMHLDDYQCVLCQQSTEETILHLLFYCPFAKNCWNLVNFHFADHLSIQQIQAWKSLLQIEFSLDIFIIFCWGSGWWGMMLFLETKILRWKTCITVEALLLLHRCKASVERIWENTSPLMRGVTSII